MIELIAALRIALNPSQHLELPVPVEMREDRLAQRRRVRKGDVADAHDDAQRVHRFVTRYEHDPVADERAGADALAGLRAESLDRLLEARVRRDARRGRERDPHQLGAGREATLLVALDEAVVDQHRDEPERGRGRHLEPLGDAGDGELRAAGDGDLLEHAEHPHQVAGAIARALVAAE